MSPSSKNPAAVSLGRLGGKAGNGQAKARSRSQAQAAVATRWAKHNASKANVRSMSADFPSTAKTSH